MGECFAPFVPEISVLPVPKPVPKPRRTLGNFADEVFHNLGLNIPPLPDPSVETGNSTSAEAGSADDADAPATASGEILPAPEEAPPLPEPRTATALRSSPGFKRCLLAQTPLSEEEAELVAFWAISTWFQDALTVLPCLVITGSAHYARILLHVLDHVCRGAKLLAGFRRGDLDVLHWSLTPTWFPSLTSTSGRPTC